MLYPPPAGYEDLEADTARVDRGGPFRELAVAGVGVFHAREPMPTSVAALAGAARPDITRAARTENLHRFIEQLLHPGEFDDLLERMILDGTLPGDALVRVSRAVATQGTARPYIAVINLALVAGRDWRTLRTRLRGNGIPDAMVLPSMHDVLDEAEAMVVENAASTAQSSTEAKAKIGAYFDQLYGPDRSAPSAPEELPIPAGFSPEEMSASFASAARSLAR